MNLPRRFCGRTERKRGGRIGSAEAGREQIPDRSGGTCGAVRTEGSTQVGAAAGAVRSGQDGTFRRSIISDRRGTAPDRPERLRIGERGRRRSAVRTVAGRGKRGRSEQILWALSAGRFRIFRTFADMIDRETVDRIYAAANIVEIIGEYVTLKRKGGNYQACCPFHNEKTPSFVVSPSKGLYKCFGCGKGGNAVTFIMEHEGVSYPEALKMVAKRYGIEVKE